MFQRVLLGKNTINTLLRSFCVEKMAASLRLYLQDINICLEESKVYGNGLAMLGSLLMYISYTNKITFGQAKLRLGL